MLKRLLLLAILVVPTPALAGGAYVHRGTQPRCEHSHSHRTYVYVPVPYRPRTRTIKVYGGQSYYENLYRSNGNVYQGNGSAYNPKPVEPLVIENPFVK